MPKSKPKSYPIKHKAIPFGMIEYAFNNNLHDTLHYWLKLKSHFKVPVYYNFSCRSIGKILKCSPSTAMKHIKKMVEQGWCRGHKGNLCMEGTRSLEKKYNTFLVKVRIAPNKRDQLSFLRAAKLIRNFNWQKKEVKKKTEIVKLAKSIHGKLSKNEIIKIRRWGGLDVFEKSICPRITMSNKKIGEQFGKSKVTGRRYQRLMNSVGAIKSTPHFILAHPAVINYELLKRFRVFKTGKGDLFLQSSNTISWECNSTRS